MKPLGFGKHLLEMFDFLCAGLRGCYQGLTATVIKQGSNQAIRFFVMETLKDWYRGDDKQKKVPTLVTGLFGAIAGTASVYGNTPVDVVKTRMQVRMMQLSAISLVSSVMRVLKRGRFYVS